MSSLNQRVKKLEGNTSEDHEVVSVCGYQVTHGGLKEILTEIDGKSKGLPLNTPTK